MDKVVHTTITYDTDRMPLEDFLRASGYKVVSIDVEDETSLARAVQDNPNGFAVVSSLINSRHVNLSRTFNLLIKAEMGMRVGSHEWEAAGIPDINRGQFGDRLARGLQSLSVPSLTVIFSSEEPSVRGRNIEFIPKSGWAMRDTRHREILGHLEAFYARLTPVK